MEVYAACRQWCCTFRYIRIFWTERAEFLILEKSIYSLLSRQPHKKSVNVGIQPPAFTENIVNLWNCTSYHLTIIGNTCYWEVGEVFAVLLKMPIFGRYIILPNSWSIPSNILYSCGIFNAFKYLCKISLMQNNPSDVPTWILICSLSHIFSLFCFNK